MDYIVFNTEAEAISAIEICWIQYVKDKVGGGCTAVNGEEYTDVSSLTDEEICALRLYGTDHRSATETVKGITINYQLYEKSFSEDKWFFPEPPANLLSLLSDYTIKTVSELIDEDYFSPDS